ncbi:Do family serine endopeptidase [Mucilaginibacter aquaedulcis]|uniref:Do family serine endopeptidase n=1 Tax=Mucilaginibacter aquaedulcis TaxID=1187081 RepID=UPI0025B49808|nr:Do family serine endopeptidase [Mucilaginibacter aquaedulcis]MDN3550756.1 Do family serine endopeptidase [Mucilaginibacter aquaedulcis]
MKKIGLTLLTAFVGGALALGAYRMIENKYADNMSFEDKQKVYFTSNKTAPVVSSTGALDFTEAAAAATPAVVYIRTTYSSKSGGSGQDQLEQMFGDMFGQRAPQRGPQQASGSGVIISPDGFIVTNNHVVENADKITVATNDHRRFEAKVIGTDPSTDLALIKVSATDLPIVKLGNSDDTRVGEWVLAVGNPFNLTSTVTAGIVSAKGRNIGIIGSQDNSDENPFGRTRNQQGAPRLNKAIESFIQTDAAINPGNSGGALVNTKGELVGINAAIASHTGSYEGYGFAIPINLAKKVLNDIKKYGSVKRGFVGVSFTELNPEVAQQLNITNTNGLYVNDVVPGGGAEQAGIKKGDIIDKVEGTQVYESSDLQEHVGRLQPGDKVNITVLREGKEKNFAVTLKADATPVNRTAAVSKSAEELFNKLGASFQPLTAAEKAKFHVNSGVKVTQVRPGRVFDNFEIPVGSVITSINKQPINSVADIDKAITNLRNGNLVISGNYPDGTNFNNMFQVQ